MDSFVPVYIKSYENGSLDNKIKAAEAKLNFCCLCPHHCKVNRYRDQRGKCNTGRYAIVSSYHPHFGEEPCLVGEHGSGTIFFSGCNLHCKFCQNFDISHHGYGEEVGDRRLCSMMLHLQRMGCHNINLVTPSHVVPAILRALKLAISEGLNIPFIYNTGGYDDIETLRILDGVVDIYMPDFKFWNEQIAGELCNAINYPSVACDAIKEMHRQVGRLLIERDGIARRGLLIRHLLMPDGISGTTEIIRYIAEEVSAGTYINIMDQYFPCGFSGDYPYINRRISEEEYRKAVDEAYKYGLNII